jgi:hypothetical protein
MQSGNTLTKLLYCCAIRFIHVDYCDSILTGDATCQASPEAGSRVKRRKRAASFHPQGFASGTHKQYSGASQNHQIHLVKSHPSLIVDQVSPYNYEYK